MFKQEGQQQEQRIPVRVYRSDGRINLVTPMPGLEPENICVTVAGDKVTIHGELRGPRQDETDLVMAEWTVGPYHREVQLPGPVNGPLTNATYGNGILVVVMPTLAKGQTASDEEFSLDVIESTRGERVGHTGRDIHATMNEPSRRN